LSKSGGTIAREYLLNKYNNIDGDGYSKTLSFDMILKDDKVQSQLGILDGLASYGLYQLSTLSPRDISWIGLL